ncbi:MAG: GAF domain-containing protein [Rhizobium sp.]|nr:MAG: GAF domain-containing protein [Rhizobium sp.]
MKRYLAMSLDASIDRTACDREPIHIPGSIQPHGLLFVVERNSGQVVGGAGAIASHFGPDWLGRNLNDFLAFDALSGVGKAPRANEVILGKRDVGGEIYDILGHTTGDFILVELEPAQSSQLTPEQSLSNLDAAAHEFETSPDTATLFQRAAVAFRKLTGFDRVMIYQFTEDASGVVIAEDRNEAFPSFLNHHFPASDIPKQARMLYLRNRVRAIPDSSYVPQPLGWAEGKVQTLDLSDVALRSVSPVHLQYLRNMGVCASASVSIIKDGILWGLIACHNASPMRMPFAIRAAATVLAGSLARQIKAKDEAENSRERLRLRAHEDRLVESLQSDGPLLREQLAEAAPNLRQMMLSDGFAVVTREEVFAHAGRVPQLNDIQTILDLAMPLMRNGMFHSHEFGRLPELPQHLVAIASGVSVLKLPLENDLFLIWLRAEKVQIVEWAGNPHKDLADAATLPLTPRASFAAWSEEVRGCSNRWNNNKIDAIHRVGRVIHESYQRQRIARLNRELQRTLEQKDELLKQKDFLMREINHRVQNSLQLVSTFLKMQARDTEDASIIQHLNDARSRISAVALVHRRLYFDNYVGSVDLARYLNELSNELFLSMGEEWRSRHTSSFSPVLMDADRAINLGLIFSELITNANKYAYGGAPGPTSAFLDHHLNQVRLTVSDCGGGKARVMSGFGSKMLDAIIVGLGGELQEADNNPGLKTIVTVPIQFSSIASGQ